MNRLSSYRRRLEAWLWAPKPMATLAFFRIFFGAVMLFSIVRFALKGWIETQYIDPSFHFTFYGFSWVEPLPPLGMYAVFVLLGLSSLGIMLGAFYRFSSLVFFLLFTYVELIDQANYLNHYYFVSLVALLLCFLPANRAYSVDVWRKPETLWAECPSWAIYLLQFQLGVVYFYAGLAKIHPEWLFEAMPLKIWLPANSHLPFIGHWLRQEWVCYAFSWAGMLYDLFVPFLLLHRLTRPWAYLAVIGFHLMTGWLFPIGMFPYIMIGATLIFFPPALHQKLLSWVPIKFGGYPYAYLDLFSKKREISREIDENHAIFARQGRVLQQFFPKALSVGLMGLYIMWQILMPFRFLLYPGDVLWTEQGYRFAWRVMLTEKAGTAIFTVSDPKNQRSAVITNSDYLTPQQEKMMSFQPDMLLQFAHHLRKEFERKGVENVEVRVEAYVSYNGRRSQLLIDPAVDLGREERSWKADSWILPLNPDAPALVEKP